MFGHNDIEETELDPYFDVQEYIVSLFGRVNQTFAVAPETEQTPQYIPDPTLVDIESLVTADFEGKFKMERRLIITSGYRTEAQGDAIGSSKSSLHRVGAAVDISRDGMSQNELKKLIEFGINVGFKGIGIYNGHLHMDVGRKGAGKRCWGPTGSRTSLAGSQFAFARSVLNAYGYATS